MIWVLTVPSISQLGILNSPFGNQDSRDIKFTGNTSQMDEYDDSLDDIDDPDLRVAATNNEK